MPFCAGPSLAKSACAISSSTCRSFKSARETTDPCGPPAAVLANPDVTNSPFPPCDRESFPLRALESSPHRVAISHNQVVPVPASARLERAQVLRDVVRSSQAEMLSLMNSPVADPLRTSRWRRRVAAVRERRSLRVLSYDRGSVYRWPKWHELHPDCAAPAESPRAASRVATPPSKHGRFRPLPSLDRTQRETPGPPGEPAPDLLLPCRPSLRRSTRRGQ